MMDEKNQLTTYKPFTSNQTAFVFQTDSSWLNNNPESLYYKKKCVICHQGEAAACSYYGGRLCCMSCRAFFGRSVKNQTYLEFKCSFKKCIIDSKSRKSCKYCRFQKCIKNGRMKIDRVLQFHNHRGMFYERQLSKEINLGITNEELQLIEKTQSQVENLIIEKSLEFYTTYPQHLLNSLESAFNKRICPFETVRAWEYLDKSVVYPLAVLSIDDIISTIGSNDRKTILKNNFPEYFGIFWGAFGGKYDMSPLSYKIGPEIELWNYVSQYTSNGIIPLVGYESIYSSPWACSLEIEENHWHLHQRINFLPRDTWDSPIDRKFLILLFLIQLFSGDSREFENAKVMEKLQLKYSTILFRYLKSKYPVEEARIRFSNSIVLGSYIRQLYELHSKMLPI